MSVIVKGGGGAAKQEKTVTAGTYVKEVLPDTGKLLSKVVVNPTPTEEKTVTPTTSQQTVSPSEGKHLAKVIIEAMEDVTPEVTAQTPIIAEIAENLGVTITTPSGSNKQILQGNNANLLNINNNAKKEGAYVWKKYAITDERNNITAVQQNSGSNPIKIKLSSPSIDLSTKDASYFVGMIFDDSSGALEIKSSTSVTYTLNNGTVSNITFTWNANTQIISLNASWGQIHTFTTRQQKLFLDYVVSDEESAYPENGEQDGYYYEKLLTESIIGTIKPSSSASTISVDNPLGTDCNYAALYIINGTPATGTSIVFRTDDIEGGVYNSTNRSLGITSNMSNHYVTVSETKVTFKSISGTFPSGYTYKYRLAHI